MAAWTLPSRMRSAPSLRAPASAPSPAGTGGIEGVVGAAIGAADQLDPRLVQGHPGDHHRAMQQRGEGDIDPGTRQPGQRRVVREAGRVADP